MTSTTAPTAWRAEQSVARRAGTAASHWQDLGAEKIQTFASPGPRTDERLSWAAVTASAVRGSGGFDGQAPPPGSPGNPDHPTAWSRKPWAKAGTRHSGSRQAGALPAPAVWTGWTLISAAAAGARAASRTPARITWSRNSPLSAQRVHLQACAGCTAGDESLASSHASHPEAWSMVLGTTDGVDMPAEDRGASVRTCP